MPLTPYTWLDCTAAFSRAEDEVALAAAELLPGEYARGEVERPMPHVVAAIRELHLVRRALRLKRQEREQYVRIAT